MDLRAIYPAEGSKGESTVKRKKAGDEIWCRGPLKRVEDAPKTPPKGSTLKHLPREALMDLRAIYPAEGSKGAAKCFQDGLGQRCHLVLC